MSTPYDVAVVGAGLVGSSVALLLAARGRRVALLERAAPAPAPGRLGFDLRTVALNPMSMRLLDGLDLGDRPRAQAIERMHVWEESGTASIDFDAASVGETALAWVVEVGATAQALFARCCDRVEVRTPASVEGLDLLEDRAVLRCGADVVEARLVVAADGAASKVRSLCGAEVHRVDAHQRAVVTVARMARPHEGGAYQVFRGGSRRPDVRGPLALLPLADPRLVAVIWSVPEDDAEVLAAADDAAFAERLGRASEAVLGAVEAIDARIVVPLAQMVAADFNPVQRVVVVGDAAHTLHPLAGQGVNLGLEDAAALDRVVRGGVADLGAPGAWRRFARTRWARAESMRRLMAFFDEAYAADDAARRWLRNVGVRFVDRTAGLKKQLVREAMGLGPLATRL